MIKKMFKKNSKLIAAVTLAATMAAAPSAFALNTPGDGTGTGNKPFSFIGYEVVDSTHVALFFNKQTTDGVRDIAASQFKLIPNAGGSNYVSSVTITSGKDTSAPYGEFTNTTESNIQNGTKVVLNLGTALTDYNLYNVTIDDTVMDDNGITIGNYQNRNNLTFTFQDPDSGGAYDTTNAPIITYVVGNGTSGLSWESEVTAISERPIKAAALSTFKTSANSAFLNTTLEPDRQVPTYESYNMASNDANGKSTVFWFPMTKSGTGSTIYNRAQSSNNYSLDLPTWTDMDDTTSNPAAYTFSTAGSDYPGWEMNGSTAGGTNGAVTVSLSGTTLTVGWYDTWVDPNPTGYKVYYIDSINGNQYTDLASWTLAETTTGHTDGNLESKNYTVTAGHTYYVRVVPYNATASVGVSKSGHN